ncbi:MAG: helix-turn-helix domain-containing protein [Enterococcus sp.]
MIEHLLINEHDSKKLAVFNFFESTPEIQHTLSSLAKKMDSSPQSIVPLLEELNADLLTIYGSPFLFEKQIIWQKHLYYHSEYVHYLFQKSVPYQFLLLSLTEPTLTMDDFEKIYYSSRSTITRQLQQLKEYLHTLGIKINFSKLKLVGKESKIRLVYFRILHSRFFTRNPLIDYVETPEQELMHSVDLKHFGSITEDDFLSMVVINKLRNQQHNKLEDILTTQNFCPETNELLTDYFSNYLVDQTQLRTQINYLAYICIFSMYYESLEDPRVQQVNTFCQSTIATDNRFRKLVTDFKKFCIDELLVPDADHSELKLLETNIVSALFVHYISENNHSMFYGFNQLTTIDSSALSNELVMKLNKFFLRYSRRKDYKYFKKNRQFLIQQLSFILYPAYLKKKKFPTVQVAINQLSDTSQLQTLTTFLSNIKFVEYKTTGEVDNSVDLYIQQVNSPLYLEEYQEKFVLLFHPEEVRISHLFAKLWEIYTRKSTLSIDKEQEKETTKS